jgi:hypothetical protein
MAVGGRYWYSTIQHNITDFPILLKLHWYTEYTLNILTDFGREQHIYKTRTMVHMNLRPEAYNF